MPATVLESALPDPAEEGALDSPPTAQPHAASAESPIADTVEEGMHHF